MDSMELRRITNTSVSQTPTASRTSASPEKGRSVLTRAQQDRIELSRQAREAVAKIQADAAKAFQDKQKKKESSLFDTEPADSGLLDETVKKMKQQRKCMEIAARIQRGDKVPRKDEEFLMKNDPKLYLMATLMRQQKEDPKKWKSILEKEDEENASSSATGEAPVESASACDSSGSIASAGGDASGESSPVV